MSVFVYTLASEAKYFQASLFVRKGKMVVEKRPKSGFNMTRHSAVSLAHLVTRIKIIGWVINQL